MKYSIIALATEPKKEYLAIVFREFPQSWPGPSQLMSSGQPLPAHSLGSPLPKPPAPLRRRAFFSSRRRFEEIAAKRSCRLRFGLFG